MYSTCELLQLPIYKYQKDEEHNGHNNIISLQLRKIRDPSPVSALVIRTNTIPPYLSSYYNLSLHPPSILLRSMFWLCALDDVG